MSVHKKVLRCALILTCLLAGFKAPAFAQLAAPPTVPQTVAPIVVHWTSPGHTRYYVDSVNGNDANDGRSPDHPWQTLGNINSGTFGPGDWILLKSGDHWDSGLSPSGSGEDRHPIKITSYGNGPKPSFDAHGTSLATVSIHNGEYWDIEDLDVSNTSPTTIPFLRGVEVRLRDFGTAHGIVLRNLTIHDISSALDKGHGGSGIFCDNYGDKVKTRFDGLLIENNILNHVDRNGIMTDSGYTDRPNWYPNLNVVIRGNLLTDIGGDCILGIGCDGALIEHNVVRGGRTRAQDWAAGIWVWSCDNTIIQYNESSGLVGRMDAQGFDADWNTQNTIIQYNYSHDNQGGFVMVVDNGDAKAPDNAGNSGTIVRYNISQNDQYRTFTCCGPIHNAEFYNNDVFVEKGDTPILIFSWNWGHVWPDHTHFWNNIFDVDGKGTFEVSNMIDSDISNNVFFGNCVTPPADPHALVVDPLFQAPGSAADGIDTVDGYRLQKHSPCDGAGIPVTTNGGRDFWGKGVPDGKNPNIGAGQ